MEVPECNVCNVPLDEEEHQPRHLGCSHDACTTCVILLIRNGFLECPMCRIVVQANTVEDFPINHGVVQVLRLFKTFKVSENKPKEESETANSKVICRIHEQSVNKGCISCKVWICSQCTEFHTPDIGCEIQEYTNYLMNSKKDHKKKVEPTLSSARKNLKSLSTEFSDLEIKKKAIEKQMEKMKKCIEDGTNTLNKFVAATDNVENASTSMELDKSLLTSNEWYKLIQIWCKNTDTSSNLLEAQLGSHASASRHEDSKVTTYVSHIRHKESDTTNTHLCKNYYTSSNLLEKVRSNQEIYTSMNIYRKCNHSKLTFRDGNLYLHCFRNYGFPIFIREVLLPYEHLQNWLPAARDLMFLDLAIAGQVQGRVTIRLRQELANYAKYIPLMFSGEEGPSLLSQKCESRNFYDLAMNVSSKTGPLNKFIQDANAGNKVVQGSVLAHWSDNYFKNIVIYHGDTTFQPYGKSLEVFGIVETGLDVVQLCRRHTDQTRVVVRDCGIIIKEDALIRDPVTK